MVVGSHDLLGIFELLTNSENKMTLEEFSKQGWGYGMQAEYKGTAYPVGSVDFEESLVGLHDVIPNLDEITWVRCENVTVLPRPEGLPNAGSDAPGASESKMKK